jgi:hypothetical protein
VVYVETRLRDLHPFFSGIECGGFASEVGRKIASKGPVGVGTRDCSSYTVLSWEKNSANPALSKTEVVITMRRVVGD